MKPLGVDQKVSKIRPRRPTQGRQLIVEQQRQEERLLLFDQLRTRLRQRRTAALDLINDPFLLTEKVDGGARALNSFERD